MEASKVIFVLFLIYAVTRAAPSNSACDLAAECNLKSEDEQFDEWVCASNDYDMRGFSGNCQMHRYNCDKKEGKRKTNASNYVRLKCAFSTQVSKLSTSHFVECIK
jgi:hypothetical protein